MSLQFNVALPKQEVNSGDFFEHLSKKDGYLWGHGFDKQIEIQRNPISLSGELFKISEVNMPWKINPLRLFMKPQSAQSKKETVIWLKDLVEREKESIVKNPSNHVGRIVKAFDRIIGNMTRNMSREDAAALLKQRDEINETLQSAHTDYYKEYFEKGEGLDEYNSASPAHFFKALSRQWTPGLGKLGFNQRFQIVERRDGRFEVHLSNKPWFFQKWAKIPTEITSLKFWNDMKPTPVSSAAKVATAQKLEAMIKKEYHFIRHVQPNMDGMIGNLTEIKQNIVRNTTSADQEKIEQAFDGAIKELKGLRFLIKKDYNNSWTGFAWNHTVVPFMNKIVVPGLNKAPGYVWSAIKLPFQAVGEIAKYVKS